MDIEGEAFQRAGKFGMLAAHGVAIVGVHQGGAMLKAALEICHGAQKLNFVGLQFALPFEAPLRPVIADILHLFADLLLRLEAVAELDECAIGFHQRFQGGIDARDGFAVELHLLADVPIEDARDEAFPGLHDGIADAAGARIDGADGGHFAERGVARVGQRHEVREGDGHAASGGFGIAAADAIADFVEDGDQLSAFHGAPSGDGSNSR